MPNGAVDLACVQQVLPCPGQAWRHGLRRAILEGAGRASRRSPAEKSSGNLQGGLQLELFADQPVPRDSDRPLLDLTHCVPSNSQYLSLAIEKGLVGDTLSGLQPAHVAAVLSTDVETTPADPAIKEMGLMA